MLGNVLTDFTLELKEKGLLRQRNAIEHSTNVINFSSNDYLSLTANQYIKKAYKTGFQRYPTGSGGSMMVCGYHPIHQTLIQNFAQALSVDDCILFSSGYAANLSITGLLGRLKVNALIDKCIHASIYDGLRLAGVSYVRYLHNDLNDLGDKFKSDENTSVLLTEGVFSMSGQLAPLDKMAQMSRSNNGELWVDEAHSFGILGYEGLGAVNEHKLSQEEVPLRVIPLGKAYAAGGAIVAGRGLWINALLQCARPHTYSTAISPALAYGLVETLDVLRGADEQRKKLRELINYFRLSVINSPLKWRDSLSPIQQLQLGCPHLALDYANKLGEQSIFCIPMREPTVCKQETGLRIILNANHQPEDIDRLFRGLHAL